MKAQPKHRYRLTFSKGYQVKYLAHLDVVTVWIRAFRRANIPLVYSQGFNPQAKIQVASSLPLGYMGTAEIMDIYLSEAIPAEEILKSVGNTLPTGFELLSVQAVANDVPLLQAALIQANYKVTVETDLSETDLDIQIEALLAKDEIIQTRIRRKKEETFNLRPLLHTLKLEAIKNEEAVLTMRVSSGQQGNLRPDAVLKALNLEDAWYQVERSKLIFTFDS